MKNFLTCIALLGALVLTSCSGDNSKPPAVPTPAGNTFAITSLTASADTALTGAAITVTATVTRNGAQAPDGTMVEFLASGGIFPAASGTQASVATSGGRASVAFGAIDAGSYTIQARVGGVTRQVSVTYRDPDVDDSLLIYDVVPREGALAGGEQVILTGKGIVTPVEVDFTVDGVVFPARVLSVVPSSSPGIITVETPRITIATGTQEKAAAIAVRVGVGTASEQQQTLPAAFTFQREIFTPVIYGIYPDQGSARGGEQVTILGDNLENATRVLFAAREAQIVSQSGDGNQIVVITPPASAQPLQTNTLVGVTVETPGGTATRNEAFLYKADQPQPAIHGVAPAAGPLAGGTRVTVFGSGFQFPARVFFTAATVTKEAAVIEVRDDTSPADNDEIVCVTPDFSDVEASTPFTASVRVQNVETGREGTLDGAFTYGDRLFISGNAPTEGKAGTEVTIFGSGFVSPLTVDYLGFDSVNGLRLNPTSISGSQMVVVMTPPDDLRCAEVTGPFRVVLLETPGDPVSGGSFTYLGESPTLLSISPSVVDETADGAGVSPTEAVITGSNFSPSVRVQIGGATLAASAVEVVSETTINVEQLPAPNDIGLAFDTVACVNGDGIAGRRRVPTPVDVSVTNTNGNCTDTLSDALTYQPQNTACVVDANISLIPGAGSTVTLPEAAAGTCSTSEQVTVRNTGGIDLEWSATISGPFSFAGAAGDINRAGTVPPGASTTFEVFFCPTVDDNANQFGQMQFLSNDPDDNPVFLNLQGKEAGGVMVVNPLSVSWLGSEGAAGGTCSAAKPVTITNNGLDELTYGATLTGRFYFNPSGSGQGPVQGMIAGGGNTVLEVYFCPPVGASQTLNGTMVVTSDDPNNQTDTVTLEGQPTFPIMDFSWDAGGNPDPFVFPTTPAGVASCSAAQPITILNDVAATLVLSYNLSLTGPFFLNSDGTGQAANGTVNIGSSTAIDVYFCPTIDNNNVQTGVFRVDSNDFVTGDPVATPFNLDLNGQEAP